MGFADKGADGQFQGVILDPEPVEVLEDGRLIVRSHPQAAE
jgi:beta-fructofuranosidase